MTNKIIICTTAICRPKLHNECLTPINKQFSKIDTYEIHWIINIDNYGANGETQEETRDNFNNLISNNIIKHFILPNTGSHPGAVNNILNVINENKLIEDGNIFFWLEDDWTIHYDFKLDFLFKYITPTTWCSLSTNFFGLQPSLIGNDIFTKSFCELNLTTDAECQVGNNIKKYIKKEMLNFINISTIYAHNHMTYNSKVIQKIIDKDKNTHEKIKEIMTVKLNDKNNPTEYTHDQIIDFMSKNSYSIIIVTPKIFSDAGRDWIKDTDLVKWDKNSRDIPTYKHK